MDNVLWRMPARLMRREVGPTRSMPSFAHTELAHGALHDMVRLATDEGDEEHLVICLDCLGTRKPLVWADIVALRREASFPIDI
jgi:hypothetical protein